mgnify:FL=1
MQVLKGPNDMKVKVMGVLEKLTTTLYWCKSLIDGRLFTWGETSLDKWHVDAPKPKYKVGDWLEHKAGVMVQVLKVNNKPGYIEYHVHDPKDNTYHDWTEVALDKVGWTKVKTYEDITHRVEGIGFYDRGVYVCPQWSDWKDYRVKVEREVK